MPEGLGPSGILPRRLDCLCGASVVTARDAVADRQEIPIMSAKKLTDTQLVLLTAASQHEDSAIELMGKPKRAVATKALIRLLNDGLLEEVAAGGRVPRLAPTQ
jgi:hypothetical protein